jgi:hypothetical protein
LRLCESNTNRKKEELPKKRLVKKLSSELGKRSKQDSSMKQS